MFKWQKNQKEERMQGQADIQDAMTTAILGARKYTCAKEVKHTGEFH